MGFLDRLQHGWNAFMNKDPTMYYKNVGTGYSLRPDRPRLSRGNERSIVTAVYNRIALDVAAINIQHCKMDDNDRFMHVIDSNLHKCLTLEANIDQTGRAFIQDVVMSMLDEGCVAIVPVDTTLNPELTNSYDILTMRTGKIIEWFPRHVKVQVYNDKTGNKEEIVVPKSMVAIIENPLYAVINEPNSTMQRLIRKLSLLDIVDEQSSSGKLDLIIQLPYVIKSETRRQQAESRRKEIEQQLAGTKYGIAYTDGTERITQLNRPVENNLMKQIEYLTSMLYSQLGITQSVLDGTADEQTMLNYHSRSIEPIISAITDEMKRKFLTKTARTQNQTITFFRDPFRLVPVNNIAEIADKFTRNEIMTSNEIRQVIGMKPSDDPKADQLVNSNISQPNGTTPQAPVPPTVNEEAEYETEESEPQPMTKEEYEQSIKELDDLDSQLSDLEAELGSPLKHYASPYYDPVKAHEYYERTKELKGRKSTATLNDEGKAAAKYVKEQLTTERKSKVDAHSAETNSKIESNTKSMQSKIESERKSMTEQVKSHAEKTQSKIDVLYAKLKKMSAKAKAAKQKTIQAQIDKLREDNEQVRQELREEYNNSAASQRSANKSANAGLRNEHREMKKALKDEYDEKYMQELDSIKSNAQFLKPKKRSKKS